MSDVVQVSRMNAHDESEQFAYYASQIVLPFPVCYGSVDILSLGEV